VGEAPAGSRRIASIPLAQDAADSELYTPLRYP
jgi:hypothetical protein